VEASERQRVGSRNLLAAQGIEQQAAQARDQVLRYVRLPIYEPPTDFSPFFDQQEPRIISGINAALLNIPEGQRIDYVSATQIDLSYDIQRRGVPLIRSDLVDPERVRVVVPAPVTKAPPPPPPDHDPMNLVWVLFDIFVDTLGAGEGVKVIAKAIARQELTRLFGEMADLLVVAQGGKDVALIAMYAEKIFTIVVSRPVLDAIVAKLGQQEVERLLVLVAARCTPFIGWSLWVISFIYAVHKNWKELTPYFA
jgi:hypothetical protein